MTLLLKLKINLPYESEKFFLWQTNSTYFRYGKEKDNNEKVNYAIP